MSIASSRGSNSGMRIGRHAPCCLALLFVIGLGVQTATADPFEKVRKQLDKRYPSSIYITDIGSSDVGPEQAEAQARVGVSARIRSDLDAVITDVTSSTTIGGRVTDLQQLVARSESRTSFKHAELILNDPKLGTKANGVWIAVGVLNRDEAARALQREYDTHALEFRGAAAQLSNVARTLPEWTATLRRAEWAFQQLLEPVFSMRALRREPREFAEDDALFEHIEVERSRRLAGVRLGLAVEGDAGEVRPLIGEVGGVLSRLGLGSAPSDCPSEGYQLLISPTIVSEPGMFGPVVKLSLSGRLVRCDGQQAIGSISIEDKDFVGTDTHDYRIARAAMWQAVKSERLLPLLRNELARYLPISRM